MTTTSARGCENPRQPSVIASTSETPPFATYQRKCHPPQLGGPHSRTACDRLFCTKCNKTVVHRSGYAWSKVDYIFVRNFYPKWDLLSERLVPLSGSAAYTCQCTWFEVADPATPTAAEASLRWVCLGHAG